MYCTLFISVVSTLLSLLLWPTHTVQQHWQCLGGDSKSLYDQTDLQSKCVKILKSLSTTRPEKEDTGLYREEEDEEVVTSHFNQIFLPTLTEALSNRL